MANAPAKGRQARKRPRVPASEQRRTYNPKLFGDFFERSVAPASLTEMAVSVIRDRILDLTLAPGLRIDERLLMERFEVSRTPAREALNRLVAEGLVEIQSNKGAFVRPLDIKELKQFFDAFTAAERMSGFFCNTHHPNLVADLRQIEDHYEKQVSNLAFMQVTRFNSEFHLRIAQATENEHIIYFSSRLHNQARRISHFIYQAEAYRKEYLLKILRKFKDQHSGIMGAITDHDNALLVDLLTEHAVLFHERLIEAIGNIRGQAFEPAADRAK